MRWVSARFVRRSRVVRQYKTYVHLDLTSSGPASFYPLGDKDLLWRLDSLIPACCDYRIFLIMQWDLARVAVWGLLAATGSAFAQGKPSSALATISPCPVAPTAIAPPAITVTEQYQPISTCTAASTKCFKRRCRTQYQYSTYDYVSTVIPCAYGPQSVSTITVTDQTVVVSRTTSTSTVVKSTPITLTHSGKPTTTTSTTTSYTTAIKEWNALYKDIGPYAVPGYSGSDLCREKCRGSDGEKVQVLDVVECKNSHSHATVCSAWPETWIFQFATPTSAATAVCQTSGTTTSPAGTYTFSFLQWAPATTIHIPQRVITYTPEGRHQPTTTTITETVTVMPRRPWTAFITQAYPRPTIINFKITVTTTIFYTFPPFTLPGPRSVLPPNLHQITMLN